MTWCATGGRFLQHTIMFRSGGSLGERIGGFGPQLRRGRGPWDFLAAGTGSGPSRSRGPGVRLFATASDGLRATSAASCAKRSTRRGAACWRATGLRVACALLADSLSMGQSRHLDFRVMDREHRGVSTSFAGDARELLGYLEETWARRRPSAASAVASRSSASAFRLVPRVPRSSSTIARGALNRIRSGWVVLFPPIATALTCLSARALPSDRSRLPSSRTRP